MLRGRLVVVTVLLAAGALLVSSCDWAQIRYGPDGTGFNPFEKTIGASNVAGLQRRWSEMSRVPSFESSPVVANGVVYASSSNGRLDAFDAATGTAKWSYSKSSPNVIQTGAWVPSPAVANGVVYDLAGDGTLYAINANVRKQAVVEQHRHEGRPLCVLSRGREGYVYVPDADLLFVFDASTGASLWSTTSVGGGRHGCARGRERCHLHNANGPRRSAGRAERDHRQGAVERTHELISAAAPHRRSRTASPTSLTPGCFPRSTRRRARSSGPQPGGRAGVACGGERRRVRECG